MPQSKRSHLWFFRVTVPHEAVSVLWSKYVPFGLFCKRVLIVGHVGDQTEKPHIHALYEEVSPSGPEGIQQQSMNERIKKCFGVRRADFASKVWDGKMGAGAGSYLFHDPNAVILVNKGFTEEEIAEFRRCNEMVREVVIEKQSKASGRCVERMLKIIADSGKLMSRKEIIYALLKDIKEERMYECGDFVLRKYVEEIYAKQLSSTQWEKYAELRIEHILREGDVELQEITFPMV